ncbi:MAG: hypothetical protein EKK53_00880 [Burkholderiales bacterium]|nr:MAG: hypothetical protein EKK53_00880 [Burkholderiales bacterium]
MLKKPITDPDSLLSKAAASQLDKAKLLSSRIYVLACERRAVGELQIDIKTLAEMAGLRPWSNQTKQRILELAKHAPLHDPLKSFVSEWAIADGVVHLRWDAAAPGEAIH